MKPAIVVRLLESLNEQVKLLRPLQRLSLRELTADPLRWNGVLHVMQVSVEHVTDIGAHMLAGTTNVVPDDYRQIIGKMGEAGILPYEFAERIAPMAGFRNIVVHRYLTVDPVKVVELLQNHLDDIDDFLVHIYGYLQREGWLDDEAAE